jgi:DNA-binding HxlR family transcriptional regulator
MNSAQQSLSEVCPAQRAWDVVSGKWKPCIIHVLSNNTMRFNELRRNVPGVTQRMLTRQLRELQENGIVNRHHYPEIPARVEYELTEIGHALLPIFAELTSWWDGNSEAIAKAKSKYQNQ